MRTKDLILFWYEKFSKNDVHWDTVLIEPKSKCKTLSVLNMSEFLSNLGVEEALIMTQYLEAIREIFDRLANASCYM